MYDPKLVDEVKKLSKEGLGRRLIARELGISPSKVYRILKKHKIKKVSDKTCVEGYFGDNEANITVKSAEIQTLPEALKYAKVDMEKWTVTKHRISSSEVTIGKTKTGTGKPETYTNFHIRAELERIVPKHLEEGVNKLLDQFKEYKPQYNEIKRKSKKGEEYLYEVALFDIHFGMLAWYNETENDYDIKIARRDVLTAVDDLIEKVKDKNITKILMPIGQDFFHINDSNNFTPRNNNKLDVDSRWAKIFEKGTRLIIDAIEKFLTVADVEILWIPGNHDPEIGYYSLSVINAWYKDCKNVIVNKSPKSRKYFQYGKCLIGYTHGLDEKHKDLPRIMADEQPEMWAKTRFREFHVGHLHKKKKMDFVGTDSFGSMTVRIIPSLTGTDYWHHSKGYVKGLREAQGFLWNKNTGIDYIISSKVLAK